MFDFEACAHDKKGAATMCSFSKFRSTLEKNWCVRVWSSHIFYLKKKNMSSVEDLGTVATVKSAANNKDLRLQRRRERERAHRQSESAEQWAEWLRRWWERDRAWRAAQTAQPESTEREERLRRRQERARAGRAAQTTEQEQLHLQQRCDRELG